MMTPTQDKYTWLIHSHDGSTSEGLGGAKQKKREVSGEREHEGRKQQNGVDKTIQSFPDQLNKERSNEFTRVGASFVSGDCMSKWTLYVKIKQHSLSLESNNYWILKYCIVEQWKFSSKQFLLQIIPQIMNLYT